MNKITIYSVPQCPYCNELKEGLTKDGVEYRDVNVLLPENQKEYDVIFEKSNSDEVPIVKIGDTLLVPNVSFHTINEGIELTKKLLNE